VAVDLPNGSTLMVSLGEEHATDPADSSKWVIKWSQDDTGRLIVLAAEPADPAMRRVGSARSLGGGRTGGGMVRSISLSRLLLGGGGGAAAAAAAGGSGCSTPTSQAAAVSVEPDGAHHEPSRATPGRWDCATQTLERYSSSGGFMPND